MSENQDLLRNVFERFAAGDGAGAVGTLLDACSPEVLVVEPPALPYGGEYRGPEGVMAALGGVGTFLDGAGTLRLDAIIGEGDEVVVRLRLPWRSPEGRSFAMPVLEWYRFEHGRIVEIRPHFWDTALGLGLGPS